MAEKNEKGKIVIISGFSGVGKGTIIQKMTKLFDDYALSVSWTTRKPRNNEIHGVNYYFVTKEKFRDAIGRNGFLEYADYNGKYYGTPRAFVEDNLEKGVNVILEIEVQGADQIRRMFPDTISVFLVPPKAVDLLTRLKDRGSESREEIRNRLKLALKETEKIQHYDYMLVNDDLDTCIEDLNRIVTEGSDNFKYDPAYKERIVRELQELLAMIDEQDQENQNQEKQDQENQD